jgi:sugar/nucleoside kinase (ribokinase family)
MIAAGPDLLIVGGLAVDRVVDGSRLAGGSVLHAARAVAAAGWSVATITAAGPEPEAAAAVAELGALGPSSVASLPASIRFAIHHDSQGRRLVLEAASGNLALLAAEVTALGARTVLLAPIAGELSALAVGACATVPVRVAAVQGWLRHLAPGEEARALPLGSLGAELSAALAELDALVASHEDLAAVASQPPRQLELMRAYFGPRPILVVTAGPDGAWLDDPATGIRHLPVARRLDGAFSIGAGDAFAALLAVGLGAGLDPPAAASAAMIETGDFLAARF